MNPEKINRAIARLIVVAVLATYCGLPELASAQARQPQTPAAQQSSPDAISAPPPASASAPAANQQPAPAPSGQNVPGMVDPSAGPLAPVPSGQQNADQQNVPNAPSSTPQPQTSQPTSSQGESNQQPLGAAGAQVGPTAGGAASKPAGNAIAPAKQRQRRSLLIKVGAVAAAAVAIGTVVALSRGTSGSPPGAR